MLLHASQQPCHWRREHKHAAGTSARTPQAPTVHMPLVRLRGEQQHHVDKVAQAGLASWRLALLLLSKQLLQHLLQAAELAGGAVASHVEQSLCVGARASTCGGAWQEVARY
jgi:hypothetical protein